MQAIEYFTPGCREGTLLKHKLLCDEPATLDELLDIADKYATADSSMKTELRVDASGKVLNPAPKTPAGDSGRHPNSNDHKRKGPAPPPASRQVATVEGKQPEERPAHKKQKGGRPAWQPAFSYEQTLDAPCKFHSGAKPSNHTTRKCHWLTRISKGEGLAPPPPAGPPPPAPSRRRLDRQSEPFKMSFLKSTPPTSSSLVKPRQAQPTPTAPRSECSRL